MNTSKQDKYDVVVIGGGPAGIMSAIQAGSLGQSVVLIEKNNMLGKKFLMTGNGRCNLTNAEFNLRELVNNYNNGEFLYHAFSVFGPKETINFFEKLGIKTKIEKNKRVFPASGDAKDVLFALQGCLKENNVKILFGWDVGSFDFKSKKINKLILKNPEGTLEIKAKKYVLCVGGKSYPLTGSNGLGYNLIENLGHSIVETMPALSPIEVKEVWVKDLQGLALKDVKITLIQNGKKYATEEGEILFTHFGLSGPCVLNISGKAGDLLKKGETKISIDIFPLLNQEKLLKLVEDILKKNSGKIILNSLSTFLPERLAEKVLDNLKIDKKIITNNISKIEKRMMINNFKNVMITVNDVKGFDFAMITRGGVSLKEIDDKTMKSKIISNLFFAGEVINVDGKTGGFNLQSCWSTGYLAGTSE